MQDYNLGFISNEAIYLHTKATVDKYRFNIDLATFNKNIIDPIKLTFDAKIYNRDIETVIQDEILRQIDKSNTNHIGYFHQNIFQLLGNGWTVPKNGYDIVNEASKIYVEMKNKHNTMNSSAAQKTYMRMMHTLLNEPNATCLLVEVIAKKSQDIPWKTTLDGQSMIDKRIRRVSIDKFYGLITGKPDAFKMLCEKLPIIIEDIVCDSSFITGENSVINELKQIDRNIMKSLYLMSFSRYEGFNNFNI